MNQKRIFARPFIGLVVLALGAMLVAPLGLTQQLNIATDPLGTASTSIKPNILFILDDSGSMGWDYLPDWINDSHNPPTTTAACFDAGDDDAGAITGNPDACIVGDPPFMSSDMNSIYYNPAIRYNAAVNFDGTSRGDQNRANTSNWTAVPTDSYNVTNQDQLNNNVTTANIATNYPDRVWCKAQTDAANSVNCRLNSAYDYPDDVFKFGTSGGGGGGGGGSVKYIGANPYSYKMQTAQACDSSGNNCKSGSSVDPTVQTTKFVEFCTDSELTNCAAGTAVTAAHTFSGVRWCSDAGTLVNCQRKKIGTYVFGKHLGAVVSQTGTFPAIANEGQIDVTSINAAGSTISQITIGATTVFSGTLPIPSGSSNVVAAAVIAAAIDPHANYNAIVSGASVVITQVPAGSAGSGDAIAITSNTIPTADAKGSITFATISKDKTARTITNVNINGVNQLCPAASNDTSFGNNVTILAPSGNIQQSSGYSSTAIVNSVRNAVVARINACSSIRGGYIAAANATTGKLDITAPPGSGTAPNGFIIALTGTSVSFSAVNLAGGAVGPTLATNIISMGGGADAFTGTRNIRIGTGKFTRTDIVPSNNSYPKSPSRSDCLSNVCSFDEEMTNFANWYTYYRTRIRMMKSAAGRAFLNVPDTFRVGFLTINPGSPVSSNKYLKIDDFIATSGSQKDNWYTKFYSQAVGNSTPLRTALSRAGWLFAGKLNTGLTSGIPVADDPVTTSCQPNFTILSTDGYWNGTGGQYLDGTTMGNEDGDPSTSPRPIYDGSSTTTTDVTTTDTYSIGAANANGCSSGQKRVLQSRVTSTRTRTYNSSSTSGTPVTDNTVNSAAVVTNFGSCAGSPTLPTPNPLVTNNPQTVATASGASNTLSDVASYFYKTDLRTPTGMSWAPNGTGFPAAISDNNVPITNKDGNSAQHMVTFTLGLGLDGTLTYRPDYETALTGDFFNITQGSANWPAPVADAPTALDDLWHTAVSGRGVFFSARDPETLANSLTDTLAALQTRVGAGAAAATSNLQPVAGDNFAFTAQYQTVDWIGDLKARTIDLTSGIVSAVQLWSAATLLDAVAPSNRRIFTFDPTDTGGNLLKHFCMPTDVGAAFCNDGAGLTAAEQLLFAPSGLAQFPYGGDAVKLATVSTDKVVNYVRGDPTYEDTSAGLGTDLFRQRTSLLGDIVNAQPAYVKKSPFTYEDPGYADFKKCTDGSGVGCAAAQFPDPSHARRGTVFAAANDGMLHAFETDVNNDPFFQTAGITTAVTADDTFTGNNAGNGAERWAYIPKIVMPQVRRLANDPYAHRYTTDGTPTVGDICIGACATQADWRTILVAGLNAGDDGYYALDITNPLAPKALWEIQNTGVCYTDAQIAVGDKTTDCNLGFSYGNAIITKRPIDGKWVVIITSGYNNNVSGGDGRGYLYVLDAATGAILHRLSTGVGTALAPSGLSKINGFTQNGAVNNTTLAIYGGDLQGNLWRFQLDNTSADFLKVTKVAKVVDSGGVAQPITVRPEIGLVGTRRVIAFGTGIFLQDADKSSTALQSIYAIGDNLSVANTTVPPAAPNAGPVVSNVRGGTMKQRVLAAGAVADTRTIQTGTAPNWSGSDDGWYIDLPETGERVNVDPQLQLGTLVMASNVPTNSGCTAGGFSFINFLDLATGSFVPGASNNMASTKIASSLTVGINIIQLPGGAVKTIVTTADNQQLSKDTPVPSTIFGGRRIYWRELIRE